MSPYMSDPCAQLEVRTFDPATLRPGPRMFFPRHAQAIRYAASKIEEWSEAYQVYYGVLPRRGGRGKRENIFEGAWLWGDVDGHAGGTPAAIALLKEAVAGDKRHKPLPVPDMLVDSGHGVHPYWKLREPVKLDSDKDRENYRRVLRGIARWIGAAGAGEGCAHADIAVGEVARVLRPVGSMNRKDDPPLPVKLLRMKLPLPGHGLALHHWEDLIPVEPPVSRPAVVSGYGELGFISKGLENWAQKPLMEGTRHRKLLGAAFWLLFDCGLTNLDAAHLLYKKACFSPGTRDITKDEIENIVRWAQERG